VPAGNWYSSAPTDSGPPSLRVTMIAVFVSGAAPHILCPGPATPVPRPLPAGTACPTFSSRCQSGHVATNPPESRRECRIVLAISAQGGDNQAIQLAAMLNCKVGSGKYLTRADGRRARSTLQWEPEPWPSIA
jgi:hypothetical protein